MVFEQVKKFLTFQTSDHKSGRCKVLTMTLNTQRLKTLWKKDEWWWGIEKVPGSGALGAPEEHMAWFGHPWHADDLPACSLLVPGQSEE